MVRFSGPGHNKFACENPVELDARSEAPVLNTETRPAETPIRPIRPRSLRDNQAQQKTLQVTGRWLNLDSEDRDSGSSEWH